MYHLFPVNMMYVILKSPVLLIKDMKLCVSNLTFGVDRLTRLGCFWQFTDPPANRREAF